MSNSLFDQLREVNEEIKKIKKTTDNLKLIFNNSDLMDMSPTLDALKLFIQQSMKSQGEMKKHITELSKRIDGVNEKLHNLDSKYQNGLINEMKPNEKTFTQNAPESRSSIVIAYPVPHPVTEIESKEADFIFDEVYSAAKKKKGNELGKMIDEIRLTLSHKNPLNPILFELSMEAGRLKSLGENQLNDQDFQILEQKIYSWKKSK
jgi:thiamine kinase-like enzyme